MSSCNFCIYENKVFDLNGYEILPDEENIVAVSVMPELKKEKQNLN